MTHGASAGQRYLPWLILFLSHWPFLTNSCQSCEFSFFFLDELEVWIGCIAKTLICWSQIDAIFKCLFWMMGFAEIMHYSMDLPVILSWNLQLYFGITLCCLCCARLIFSHGWEIIYFFWIMCAMILSIYQHVGQILTYCYANEITGFTAGISLYTTVEISLYTCNAI